MQKTTSEQTTVAASLGISASAGWGPISASVSTSLSQTSSTFQQVTLTEERTSFVSDTLENKTDKPRMLLIWQLTDIVTVFEGNGVPLSSIVSRNAPNVIGGPYDPNSLPAAPALSKAGGKKGQITPSGNVLKKSKKAPRRKSSRKRSKN